MTTDLTAYPTIDVMNHLLEVRSQLAGNPFEFREFQIMLETTFKAISKPRPPADEQEREGRPARKGGAGMLSGHATTAECIADMDALGYTHISVCATKMWSYYYHRDFIMNYPVEAVAESVAESGGRIIGTASYNPFRITDSLAEVERAVKEFGFRYVWFHPLSYGLPPTTVASTRSTRSASSSASPSASRWATRPRCCRPTAAGRCWPTTWRSSSPTCASTSRTPAGRGSTNGARCSGATPTCTATSPPTTHTASTSGWCASWTRRVAATRCCSAPTASASNAAKPSSSNSTSARRPSEPCCTTTPSASSPSTADPTQGVTQMPLHEGEIWGEITQASLERLLERKGVSREDRGTMFRINLSEEELAKADTWRPKNANFQITKETGGRIARGIADLNPLYLDEGYAKRSNWGRLLAAPGNAVLDRDGQRGHRRLPRLPHHLAWSRVRVGAPDVRR